MIDFNEEMSKEKLQSILEENDYLKTNLKIMNGLLKEDILDTDDNHFNFNKLYEDISLLDKKDTLVQYTPESAAYYYRINF